MCSISSPFAGSPLPYPNPIHRTPQIKSSHFEQCKTSACSSNGSRGHTCLGPSEPSLLDAAEVMSPSQQHPACLLRMLLCAVQAWYTFLGSSVQGASSVAAATPALGRGNPRWTTHPAHHRTYLTYSNRSSFMCVSSTSVALGLAADGQCSI